MPISDEDAGPFHASFGTTDAGPGVDQDEWPLRLLWANEDPMPYVAVVHQTSHTHTHRHRHDFFLSCIWTTFLRMPKTVKLRQLLPQL
jgi:hypothetical protein